MATPSLFLRMFAMNSWLALISMVFTITTPKEKSILMLVLPYICMTPLAILVANKKIVKTFFEIRKKRVPYKKNIQPPKY